MPEKYSAMPTHYLPDLDSEWIEWNDLPLRIQNIEQERRSWVQSSGDCLIYNLAPNSTKSKGVRYIAVKFENGRIWNVVNGWREPEAAKMAREALGNYVGQRCGIWAKDQPYYSHTGDKCTINGIPVEEMLNTQCLNIDREPTKAEISNQDMKQADAIGNVQQLYNGKAKPVKPVELTDDEKQAQADQKTFDALTRQPEHLQNKLRF